MRAYILRNIQRFNYCLIVLLLPALLSAQQGDTLNVLFVGNSFTYFWNLPQVVQSMAESQDRIILTRQSTAGGSSLEQHWKGEKGLKTKALIESGGWDYVVLQDHSLRPINAPKKFMEYGKKFADLVRSVGAEPMFSTTWAYKSNPLMQAALTRGYSELAKTVGAKLIPVGPVWASVRQFRPNLELFFDDKHPTPLGTYLIALAMYKKLSGQSVSKIPDRLTTTDQFGENIYLLFVLPADGKFLRQSVEEFGFEKPVEKHK